jgi:hypothetical protein
VSIGGAAGLRPNNHKIGIIAEDDSDVAVLRQVIRKYLPENQFQTKKFVGRGCAKVRKKCLTWANLLLMKGCHILIVMHDLDNRDESELRICLESKISSSRFGDSVVVIPIRAVEAWLLTDAAALARVFGLQREPKLRRQTELIERPKAYLGDKIWQAGKKRYIHTIHNEKIASEADLSSLKRCSSFLVLDRFIRRKCF